MAGIDELIAQLALGAAQKQAIAESDPYAPGMGIADQIGNLAVTAGPQYKTRDKIILGALSGLAGGLFSGASQDYQSRAADAYSDAVFGFGKGLDVQKPSVLSPTLFSSAKQQGNLFQLRRALQAGEMADALAKESKLAEIKGAQEVKTELAKELIKNPRRGAQAANAIASLFGKPAKQVLPAEPAAIEGMDADQSGLELALGGVPSVKAPTEDQLVSEAAPAKDKAMQKVLGILGGNFGQPESIEDKQLRIAQRFMDEGATPGAAFDSAAKQIEADRLALKASTKKVDQVREAANQAMQLADVAQTGIEGAGATGGFGGGLRNFGSQVAALVSPEQQQKQASQTLLDSVRPEIVSTMRSPGAISDFESKMLIGAGPSSANTPEANRAIINKIRGVAKINEEYGDFLEWYREKAGTITGADKVWQAYKKDHPLVIGAGDGQGEFNTNRVSIFDWLNSGDTRGKTDTAGDGAGAPAVVPTPAQKANVATQVQAPSWSQSARFVGKSLAEGAANTLGMAADFANPIQAASTIMGAGQRPSETLTEARKAIVGTPEEEGIAPTPGVNVIRSGLNAVAFPGAPVSNALGGMGAQAAKEAGAGPIGQIVAGAATGSLPTAAKGLSNIFKKTGEAFDRSSVGALAKDFVKSQRDKGLIESPDEAKSLTTRLSTAIKEIADKKGLGFWRDPDSLAIKNEKALETLGGRIGKVIEAADDAGVSPVINFSDEGSAVAKLVDRSKAEKAQVKKAFDEFLERFTDPTDGWDGKISSLNQWKSSVGNLAFTGSASGSLSPQVARRVQRAIYSDLDRAVAGSVEKSGVIKSKDWKQLLRDYSNHAEIEPIIAEQVAKGQSSNIEKATSALLRTSGGTLTTPTLIGAAAGGAVGGPAGLLAGAALGSLRSPTVQGVVGSGLQKAGSALGAVGAPASAILPATAAGALSTQPQDDLDVAISQARQSIPAQAVTPEPVIQESQAMPIQKPKAVPDDLFNQISSDPVDLATMMIESAGNPKAKNPTSSASGLFQLINKTASNLGVKDVFDPYQNYEGYLKLKAQAEPYVEEPSDYYAFHFLGQPTYLKWKQGAELSEKQAQQVAQLENDILPKWNAVYQEAVGMA